MTCALPSEPAIPNADPKEQPAPVKTDGASREIREDIYRQLVEQANEAIYVVQDGRVVFANAAFSRIRGGNASDLPGLSMDELIHPDDRARVWNHHRRLSAGEHPGNPFEIQVPVHPAGTRWISINSVPFAWNGQPATLNYATDITERKQAEAALMESREEAQRKLHAILSPEVELAALKLGDILDAPALQSLIDDFFELTRIGIAITDLEGNVLVAAGWQDICTKFHRTHPVACQRCKESDTALSKGVAPGEFKLYRCKNNMWDIATPIVVGNRHFGNILLGQFLFDNETPDRELFLRQAREYGFEERAYLAALERVPRWNRTTVNTVMSFYSKLALLLSNLSLNALKMAHASEAQKTAELQRREQLEELNRWHKAMLGRESRNLELKREVNSLLAQAGLPERYASVTADGDVKK